MQHNRFKNIGSTILFVLVLGVVPTFYNSCSSDHSGSSGSTGSLSKSEGCELKPYFAETFKPFLEENCATCHQTGGTGNGAFADSSIDLAWEAFSISGYSKVSNYAISTGHNPPYTGEHNIQKVNELNLEWSQAEEERQNCLNGTSGPQDPVDVTNWISTRSQAVNAVDEEAVVLRWHLGESLLSLPEDFPDLSGAYFEVTVRTGNILNKPYYIISQPTLDLSGVNYDVTVKGLKIKLNGEFVPSETAFTYMERSIRRKEGKDTSMSSGTILAMGALRSSDVIALAFESFNTDDLPPAPPGAKVNFNVSQLTAPSESGEVQVRVELDAPVNSHAVIVGLEIDGLTDATPVRSGRVIRNGNGDNISIRNFDWDYSIDQLSIVFLPNETSKTVTIKIAEDERYEIKGGDNEKIVLRLGRVDGAEVGVRKNIEIIIPDDDVALDPDSETLSFSQLMTPGGVLYDNCLACHNSEDKRGGYDLSNYQEMIDRNVLIPGDVSSKMFIRMSIEQQNTDTMPLTGLLPSPLRREVERWIGDGATNN